MGGSVGAASELDAASALLTCENSAVAHIRNESNESIGLEYQPIGF
jgi:hypothetical protein